MAQIHLHPTACNRDAVTSIQRRTGLIATAQGELITHSEHQRRLNSRAGYIDRIISPRIREALMRHQRRKAEARCRYPDPEAPIQPNRSHRQDMVEHLRNDSDLPDGAA